MNQVVPYVGTWIEMPAVPKMAEIYPSRSLRGNVDRNQRIITRITLGSGLVVPYVGTWIEISIRQHP